MGAAGAASATGANQETGATRAAGASSATEVNQETGATRAAGAVAAAAGATESTAAARAIESTAAARTADSTDPTVWDGVAGLTRLAVRDEAADAAV